MNMKMSFPTQNVVENFLSTVFPVLSKGCLNASISKIGSKPEAHQNPGAMGTLLVHVNTITGVDIPIMVKGDENMGNKTVAIVAQDPLRNSKDIMLQPFAPFDNPIVGTPFAFHYKQKVCKQTKVYREIIHGLLQKGYNVYVTDIWKCWDNSNTKKMGKWGINNPHYKCLVSEINSIKPDYVILMGKQAINKLHDLGKNLNYTNTLVSVPHPSGSANGAWAKILNGNRISLRAKVDYILNMIP